MAVNAKPYKEGKGWVIRLRYKDNDIYISGQSSAAKAVAEAQKEVNHIDKHGQAAWGGAKGKTVAQALQRQAAQTLRFKKGAAQEARRINCYLRHGGLDELVLTKLPDAEVHHEEQPADGHPSVKASAKKQVRVYFTQTWKFAQQERSIPNSLSEHRKLLTVKTADSDRWRAQIARSKFTEVNLPSTAVPCLGLAGENGSCEPLCFRAQHLLCNRDRDAHQLNPGLLGLALVVHVQDEVDALDPAWV